MVSELCKTKGTTRRRGRYKPPGRACRQQGCLHKDDGSCVVAGAKIFSRPKRKKSEDMMDLA